MINDIVINAAIDGLVNSVCFFAVGQFLISPASLHITLFTSFGIGALLSLSIAVLFFFLTFRIKTGKGLFLFCAVSTMIFLVASTLHFACDIRYFPAGEANSAEGFVIMVVLSAYLLFSLLLKAGIVAILTLRGQGQRGGSPAPSETDQIDPDQDPRQGDGSPS